MVIKTAGVVGLGTMGAGIAEVFARGGLEVVAVEVSEELAAAGRERIEGSLQRAADKGRLEPGEQDAIRSRLRFGSDRADLAAADLVVEAVPERLEAKTELFTDLDRRCPPATILATNTSSLSVTSIAAASGRPGRVVGMHFFNPAPVMRLVEVVRTVMTDEDTADSVVELAGVLGKTPVAVGDRAGFVANALLLPYLNDAAAQIDAHRADPAELDAAMAEAADLPMGPLALMDLIGLDVCVAILDVLWEEFRHRRYAATPLLRRLAAAGHLGRKTGRGWFDYTTGQPAGADPIRAADPARGLLVRHLADALRMVDDGYAAGDDVDTAMRLGCGYRRGPFELLASAPPDVADAARAVAASYA